MYLYRSGWEIILKDNQLSTCYDFICDLSKVKDIILNVDALKELIIENTGVLFPGYEFNEWDSKCIDVCLSVIGKIYRIKFMLRTSTGSIPTILGNSDYACSNVIFLGYDSKNMILYNTKPLDEHLESMGEFEDKNNEDHEDEMDIEGNQDISQLQTFDGESHESMLNQGEEVEFIKDNLGRNHIKCPHFGTSAIYLRNIFFHEMTALEHINDLAPLCFDVIENRKGNMIIIGDNGPDYNPSKNMFLFGRLWETTFLDSLTITTNPAGLSANIDIEHLWSPLSNALTSILDSTVPAHPNLLISIPH